MFNTIFERNIGRCAIRIMEPRFLLACAMLWEYMLMVHKFKSYYTSIFPPITESIRTALVVSKGVWSSLEHPWFRKLLQAAPTIFLDSLEFSFNCILFWNFKISTWRHERRKKHEIPDIDWLLRLRLTDWLKSWSSRVYEKLEGCTQDTTVIST